LFDQSTGGGELSVFMLRLLFRLNPYLVALIFKLVK